MSADFQNDTTAKTECLTRMVMFTLGLPLLYVMSVGPAIWCGEHGFISEQAFEAAYYPLNWVSSKWESLYNLVDEYACFWQGL